jgi:pyrroloquinoline-quinone synthase
MSLLRHPFYQEWTAGTLTFERLRHYTTQYYRQVEAFPRHLSAIHSRCDDLATRQALLENLIDEERGTENHPELWLRFAEALGLTRKEVLAAEPTPAAVGLVDTFTRLSRETPLQAALAALYVYEVQVRDVADTKIDGLRRFYGVSDEAGLKFFTVHREADLYHSQAIAKMIERYCEAEPDNSEMLEAGRTALRAVWNFLDTV